MLQGKEYDGAKSDIWSAGCILFSLLVGKVPFSDGNLEALFRKIVFAKVSMPLTLELDAVSLLTKLLTKSP
jgi:5'-AMP-activated protein kinase catalytic alpha subunit